MMGSGFIYTLILIKDGDPFHSFLKANFDTSGMIDTFKPGVVEHRLNEQAARNDTLALTALMKNFVSHPMI
jgi:hypothetical protein